MRDDYPQRLVAKLEEVRTPMRGVDGLSIEAAAAGLKRRPTTPELTAREQTVFAMLADGLTNREIGERLELSTRTVKDHVSSIYRRLEVHNRADAMKHARDLGLI